MVKRWRKDQRGIALLAALMAVAMMTLIVVDFTTSSALGYLSAANQANELRAGYLAKSAINVGLALLALDSRLDAQSKTPFDSLNDVWATPFPQVNIGGGTVSLTVVDEARKYDINQVVNLQTGQPDPVEVTRLTSLLALLNMPPELVPAIIDWLDPDSVDSPGGAEADYYLQLIPPYEPRNGPMPTIGDLRMVRGVNDDIFVTLRNYLTVMPEPKPNANTASAPVLACLEPELTASPQSVMAIIQARTVRPFTSTTDIANLPGMGVNVAQKLTADLTTRSVYFTISGIGAYAGARKVISSTFRRNGNGTALLADWHED